MHKFTILQQTIYKLSALTSHPPTHERKWKILTLQDCGNTIVGFDELYSLCDSNKWFQTTPKSQTAQKFQIGYYMKNAMLNSENHFKTQSNAIKKKKKNLP